MNSHSRQERIQIMKTELMIQAERLMALSEMLTSDKSARPLDIHEKQDVRLGLSALITRLNTKVLAGFIGGNTATIENCFDDIMGFYNTVK